MSEEIDVLSQGEVTKLTLAVARGLTPPFTKAELIAEAEKVCAWARGVRLDTALLMGLLDGQLGVKFDGMTEPEPEAKFFRLTGAKAKEPETCPHGGAVSENAGAKMCSTDHVALMHEADVLIEEKLDTGEPASDSWLAEKMRERHPEEPADRIRFVVNAAFKARRAAEFAGKSPADLLAEAAELERYFDEREKNSTGVDGKGNG